MKASENMMQDLESVLFTAEEIKEKVVELGKIITEDYKGKRPVVICILKGASVFYCDLIREIDLPLELEFMAVSSYGASTKSSGEVRIIKDLDKSIHGRDVIIVEDIIDSGMTLTYLQKALAQRGATSVKIATLLDKPARRRADLHVDYVGFKIPDAFVVGYGLDYDAAYRNLKMIGILAPRMYQDEE